MHIAARFLVLQGMTWSMAGWCLCYQSKSTPITEVQTLQKILLRKEMSEKNFPMYNLAVSCKYKILSGILQRKEAKRLLMSTDWRCRSQIYRVN